MFDFLKKKISQILKPEKSGPEGTFPEERPVEVKEERAEKKKPEKTKKEQSKPIKTTPKKRVSKISSTTVEVEQKKTISSWLFRKNLDDILWELELALLEGDVAKPVAEKICQDLKESNEKDLRVALRKSLLKILSVPSFDLVEKAKNADKPFKILFLGPNGAGKTLTLAKIAYLFKQNGMTSIFAASDTFRAASIEQLEEHGRRLGVKVIKHSYGADPAAVAFDAVKSAKARGIDCVLIDTAGRQETNRNLIEELKKINRVVQPDLRIYVDEALAGNVLPERALAFKEAVGLDGVILTKMDADVKGGGAISISYVTGVPVLYLGTGQNYEDLKKFDPDEVVSKILG